MVVDRRAEANRPLNVRGNRHESAMVWQESCGLTHKRLCKIAFRLQWPDAGLSFLAANARLGHE